MLSISCSMTPPTSALNTNGSPEPRSKSFLFLHGVWSPKGAVLSNPHKFRLSYLWTFLNSHRPTHGLAELPPSNPPREGFHCLKWSGRTRILTFFSAAWSRQPSGWRVVRLTRIAVEIRGSALWLREPRKHQTRLHRQSRGFPRLCQRHRKFKHSRIDSLRHRSWIVFHWIFWL